VFLLCVQMIFCKLKCFNYIIISSISNRNVGLWKCLAYIRQRRGFRIQISCYFMISKFQTLLLEHVANFTNWDNKCLQFNCLNYAFKWFYKTCQKVNLQNFHSIVSSWKEHPLFIKIAIRIQPRMPPRMPLRFTSLP